MSRALVDRARAILDQSWTKNARLGLRLIIAATLVTIVVAFMGPSAVTLRLGPRSSFMPPWYLPSGLVSLNEWVAVLSLWLGLAAGSIGLWICYRAVDSGWRPSIHRLFALGAALSLVTSLVPPLTSADVLMYAAYGRLMVLGWNPYDIAPGNIIRQEYDPVMRWVEAPWQDTPSVYGPIATFSQWLAATLGGESMHQVVFWLQMFALLPFLAIAFIAVKMAHGDPAVQTRAVLFTILNPIMIWSICAQAHNEPLTLVFAVVGLWFIRRNAWLAGVGIGLAGCVKVSLVYYGLAMVWGYRHQPWKLIQLCLAAAVTIGLGYGLFAPEALFAAARNTSYVSAGSWAEWLLGLGTITIGDGTTRRIISLLGTAGMVTIAWMLSRVLPWVTTPGAPPGTDPRRDPLTITVRTAALLTAAWLITSPYTLSWYDLITWVPLALMAANRLDVITMWRGTWLSLAYVAGRVIEFGPGVVIAGFVMRDVLCTAAQMAAIVWVVWWWRSEGGELPRLSLLRDAWRRFRGRPAAP
ncbi:MAG: polyprenol phosphomannose-dependent alpha 1,6 mannosyltransferase MptB [Micropruina sp.]|uniref:polyprenol phosphomannose-dependent alpha 1,6 mannosyltransferase MptB n=1 Tax=Micropruina sp. TaxID=2737536 RepID=UPI0039E52331